MAERRQGCGPVRLRWMVVAWFLVLALPVAAGEDEVPLRVACVGDSITWGDRLEDRAAECYPARLAAKLGAAAAVRNFGASGATMQKRLPPNRTYWRKEKFGEAIVFAPDVVVLMLGTNDSVRDWFDEEAYGDDALDLIALFRMLPTRPTVIVCTIPPLFLPEAKVPETVHPSGSQPTLIAETIAPAIRRIAEKADAPLVDAYALFEGREDLLPDKIHPGKEGADMLAEAVAKAIRKALPGRLPAPKR
ncbi:MAG: GDSL-type esterase/lipase family protein [Planctomycetota bacterium]